MRRSRKIILVAVLGIVVLFGSIGGVALAQTDEDDSQPQTRHGALLDRACEIYNANPDRPGDIDSALLKDAFAQASSELRDQARERIRERLIEEGKITEEQLADIEAWLAERPDFPTEEFKTWLESRPDVTIGPGLRGFGGHRGFGAFGGKLYRWCEPQPAE